MLWLACGAGQTWGQAGSDAAPDSLLENTIEAGEADVAEPRRRFVKLNEFEGPFFTLRIGAGIVWDLAAFAQDSESKQQLDLEADTKVRDGRLLLKGKLKFKRDVTYTAGIMYDGATDSWLFRESGIMVALPELWGHVFIGRTKEGFSLNRVMSGYSNWTMERATISDATVPILADGVKWLGHLPNHRLLWNIGCYTDWVSEGQSFSTYDHQFVIRLAWLPWLAGAGETLLHMAGSVRYGKVDGGQLRLRSRPELNIAPYFVDTDKFPAHHSTLAAYEVYYRTGSWLLGSEYFLQQVGSPETGDPVFHGGDAMASWLVTGETRAFNTVGGYFKSVSPARTVFEGGPGAWEGVLRFSYINLKDGPVDGGAFWRLTPMVNWHMSDHLRLECAYGYGKLSRFGLQGGTHFFQGRIQLVI